MIYNFNLIFNGMRYTWKITKIYETRHFTMNGFIGAVYGIVFSFTYVQVYVWIFHTNS